MSYEVGYTTEAECFSERETSFRKEQGSLPNVRNNNYKRLGMSPYEDQLWDLESEVIALAGSTQNREW